MQDLVAIIRKIEREKTDRKIHPVFALISDIARDYTGNDLGGEISRLIEAGTIIEGRTINQRYYQLTEKDQK